MGLRQVAQVAAAAYVDRERPAGGGVDPLVTSDGSRLRFEAFSRCGGVLGRLDVLPEGLDGAFLERGTTNVDVNEPLRGLLTRVRGGDFLHLEVGCDGLVASSPTESASEHKVTLSDRWLRGFAEAQAAGAGFDVRAESDGPGVLRFLGGLGRRAEGWLVQAGAGWRLSSRPAPGAVWLGRADRLESLLPVLPTARRVRVFGPSVSTGEREAPSAWEVELLGARFVLHLSAAPGRGFSGDGSVLKALTATAVASDAEVVGAELDHQSRLEPSELADRLGLSVERVRAGLAGLAVAGRVGYDVTEAAYFHRDLPFHPTALARLNPRLRSAEALAAGGGVVVFPDGRADVRGSSTVHRVRIDEKGDESCTCRWWTSHEGRRGPCRHVLAYRLLLARRESVGDDTAADADGSGGLLGVVDR